MDVSPRSLLFAASAVALLAWPSAARAQDPGWMRGLDELMSIEVTSVSRKEQRLADTSAAIFVLTREDIRRSGLRTAAELLRLVPGVHVAQIDGNKWAISSRGMSGRWSNKLLVMIDGRSLYTPYFAGTFWEAIDVPVAAIERIEVIRGPGASVWGTNAVNGVINIITMGAPTSRETTVTAGAGSTDFGGMLHEGRIGDRIGYRLFADAAGYDELSRASGAGAQDDWMQRRIGAAFRATLNSRDIVEGTFHGNDSHARSTHIDVLSLAPFRNELTVFESDAESWAISGRWTRQLTGAGHLQVNGFMDQWRRADDLDHVRRTYDVSLQHRFKTLGRHDVIWGGGYRATHETTKGNRFISVSPDRYDHLLASAFAQDDIALGGRVHATLGAKIEHRDFTGTSFQPTARLHWRIDRSQAVWTAVSRAQRAPDRIERSLHLNMAAVPLADGAEAVVAVVGNPEIAPEWVTAYEVGYRRILATSVTLDLAGYVSRYSNLITNVPGEPRVELDGFQPYLLLPFQSANAAKATTAGGEAVIAYTPAPRLKLSGSYSLFSIDADLPEAVRPELFDGLHTPRHQATLRSSITLTRQIDLDTTLFAVGAIEALRLPAYTRVDHRVAWRPRSPVELSLAVQNFFAAWQIEFNSPATAVPEASLVPRTAYGAITWRF